MAQDAVAVALADDEVTVPGHSTYAVFSVLSNILDKDEVSLHEFEEKDRPKDDYIDHETLREWFSRRLRIASEHHMSLREIWRNFCFEYRIYCSLPLFGNVVLRHVLQTDPAWKGVTKVGDIKQKRYNLTWIAEPAGSEYEIDAFFARIKDEKEKVDRTKVEPRNGSGGGGAAAAAAAAASAEPPAAAAATPAAAGGGAANNGGRAPVFLDPTLLSEWWNRRLEPTDPSICRMRMRDIYDRFVIETNVNMPKALFGELSVRYVLSSPAYTNVVRKGKIHSKRYSLQWRNAPITTTTNASTVASSHGTGNASSSSNALPAVSPNSPAGVTPSYSSSSSSSSSSPSSPVSSPQQPDRWAIALQKNYATGAATTSSAAPSVSAASSRSVWGSGPHPSNPRPVNV